MRPLVRRAGAGSEPGGWRHAAAAVAAALFVVPLVLMVTGSLRDTGLPPPRGPELLPSPLAFENYGFAFDLVDMPRYVAVPDRPSLAPCVRAVIMGRCD